MNATPEDDGDPARWIEAVDHLVERALRGENIDPDLDALPAEVAAKVREIAAGLGRFHRGVACNRREATVEPGHHFGPYQVRSRIGSGGQAVVYSAVDTRLNRTVAMKVLPNVGGPDAAPVRRLLREARVLAQLNDPSICAVHDVGSDNGVVWVAMQWVPGETLAQRLSELRDKNPRQGMPIDLAVSLVARVGEAIHRAHEKGIVHRDLKPANIMLTPDGEPVVLDFGLATIPSLGSRTLTVAGQVLGTPGYMAPEQVRPSLGETTRQADVFSLGIVLFECLTLARPFERSTGELTLHAVVHDEPPNLKLLRPDVPNSLALVVATALNKEPRMRYQTAEQLARDVRAATAGARILARPTPWYRHALRWIRRHPLAAIVIVGLVAGSNLVTSSIATWQDRVRLAQRDWEQCDVGTAVASLIGIPDWWLSLFAPADLASLAFRGATPGDPVARCVARTNRVQAMLELATPLQEGGPGADPLALAFFARLLDGLRTGDAIASGKLIGVLEVLARLFAEREPHSAAEAWRWEPITRRVRESWATETNVDRRMWLLSCLSGCGCWSDALMVLEWLRGARGAEEVRLGYFAVGAMIRRAHRHGLLTGEGIDLMWRSLSGTAAAQAAVEDASMAWKALLLAERANRPCFSVAHRLPTWLVSPIIGTLSLRETAQTLRCAAGDPTMYSRLLALDLQGQMPCIELSRLSALLDPSPLGRCSRHEDCPDFDRGVRNSLEDLRGVAEEHLPDTESTLGAKVAVPFAPAHIHSDEALSNDVFARWSFRAATPELTGMATDAKGTGARLASDGGDTGHLRLFRFGESEINLHLRCSRDFVPADDPHLRISHQPSFRSWQPFGGKIVLTVLLDGEAIDTTTVHNATSEPIDLPIAYHRLGCRSHVLTLRLEPDSTTTYRVYEIVLRLASAGSQPR